jgi:hypothetical protein
MNQHDQTNKTPFEWGASTSARKPCVEIDFEAYAPYLESADISEDEKRQLIEAVWSIVTSFVQLGFGLTPAQQILESRADLQAGCGQVSKNQDDGPPPASERLDYPHSITSDFVSSTMADDEEGASA